MTNEDIATIEAQLEVVLPSYYKLVALAGRFADPIHDDAKTIVAINRAFRNGDFGDEEWHHQMVAIGHDGSGNYFCLRTDSPSSGVYLRDHETLAVTQEYDTFDAFVLEWM